MLALETAQGAPTGDMRFHAGLEHLSRSDRYTRSGLAIGNMQKGIALVGKMYEWKRFAYRVRSIDSRASLAGIMSSWMRNSAKLYARS